MGSGAVGAALDQRRAFTRAGPRDRLAGGLLEVLGHPRATLGDPALLEPGLQQLAALTGRPTYGVLPHSDQLWLDA